LVRLQLNQRCKTVEALAHVRHSACDPNLRPGRQPDHRHCASACSTAESCDVETSPATRTRTLSGHSISIVPEELARAGVAAGAATFTGSSCVAFGGRVWL